MKELQKTQQMLLNEMEKTRTESRNLALTSLTSLHPRILDYETPRSSNNLLSVQRGFVSSGLTETTRVTTTRDPGNISRSSNISISGSLNLNIGISNPLNNGLPANNIGVLHDTEISSYSKGDVETLGYDS